MTENSSPLRSLGWDDRLAALANDITVPSTPGRVVRVDRGLVTVRTETETVRAIPPSEPIATGDWVMIEDTPDGPTVLAILPRSSVFMRGDSIEGVARDEQIIAANIDSVFVVHSLTNGPNPRRLERELILVYESGAMPIVVLTKADLVDDVEDALAITEAVAPALDIVVVSGITGEGIERLRGFASEGRTVALIGASGVGKSTLVNALMGEDVQATGDVRTSDQRGRHTTTARELIVLPSGGVLIDTPGLRAVSLWDADEGFTRAFADIEALALDCKFRDCAHRSEPECAVLAAIERNELDAARLESYHRLDQELDAAARRRDSRVLSKSVREMYKIRDKPAN